MPSPRLDTIFPPGGRLGTQVEVGLTGADLDEAKTIKFSHPGITAEPKEKRFVVKIAADVPPGIYDARAVGLLGISNPRAFAVGDLPENPKPAGNNKPETAAEVPVGSTVSGVCTAAGADYYKFTGKAGQRVIIDCEAPEIDSRLRPVISLSDAAGRELEISRRGGLLDFTPAADGSYVVRVQDLTFAGTADYFYRLTVTTGPHLEFVSPACAQPGAKGKFTLYGRNLPGGVPAKLSAEDGQPLQKLEVEIDVPAQAETRADGLSLPAAAPLAGFSYRLKAPTASNPVFIGFTNETVVAEHEPNNRPEEAQKLTPPCEVSGQFFPSSDVDTYSFEAKKGDVWWIEVISQRLDLPTNPFIILQRDQADVSESYGAETNIGGGRFGTASNDPAFRFAVKDDGTYRLKVRDLFGGNRKDPRSLYRLSVRKELPDFSLAAVIEPPPETKNDRSATPRGALLRANGTVALKVLAFRRDGFAGEIELSAEGLPAGVTCLPTKIPAGAAESYVLLTSSDKPTAWAGAIRVLGKAKVGDRDLVREARGGAVRWTVADTNIDQARARLARDISLAVTPAEPAPVAVAAAENKRWEIAAPGKLEIPLKIARAGEFKEALKLKAFGAPGIEPLKEIDVAPTATTAKATLDLATAKIPPGEHIIHFQAQTKGKFRGKDVITTIYSAPISISVQAPPVPPKK